MRKSLILLAAAALAFDGSRRSKMKVTFGDLITNGSGSAGGHTYSRNKGGAYRKNRPIPTQPRTPSQMGIRQGLATFSAAWRGLTDAQRDAWNAAAKSVKLVDSLGKTYQPTGHQYYVALNQSLAKWKQWATDSGLFTAALISDPITDPPGLFSPDSFQISNLVIDSSPESLQFDLDNGYTGTGQTAFLVQATPGLSPGITNPTGNYRFIGVFQAPAGASSESLATLYDYIFGAISGIKRIFVRVIPIDLSSGQQGLPVTLNAISA